MSNKEKCIAFKKNIFFRWLTKKPANAGKKGWRFYSKRIALIVLFLTVFFWLGKSIALYFFFKHVRDYPEVKLTEMFIFPFNIDAYRSKMGNYDVEQCKHAFAQKEYYKAAVYAYTGVSRSPDNLEGRIYLATLNEQYFRRLDHALETLRQGMPTIFAKQNNYDQMSVDYMRFFCKFLLQHGQDKELLEVIDKLLGNSTEITNMNQILAMAAAKSHYLTGDFVESIRYLEDYQLLNNSAGILLQTEIFWAHNQKEKAISILTKMLKKFPGDDLPYQRIISYLGQEKRYDEALMYARRYNIRKPFSSVPRIMMLYTLHEKGDTDQVDAQVDLFIQQFRQDNESMKKLGLFAAEVGKVDVSLRLYQESLQKENTDKSTFPLLLLEAYISTEEYEKAAAFIQKIEKEMLPTFKEEKMEDVFYGLSSVIYYAQENQEQGDYYFGRFNESNSTKRDTLVSMAKHYRGIERLPQANEILRVAYKRFSRDDLILAELIETNIALGLYDDFMSHLESLLKTRHPPLSLLQKAYNILASDSFLFSQERDPLLAKLENYIQLELKKHSQQLDT